ncbi:MAG: hypothetical protein HY747_02085 [Elusimicrobia bacterium]|nr:hypothetical protein [Elusimicrobiota bacterium]
MKNFLPIPAIFAIISLTSESLLLSSNYPGYIKSDETPAADTDQTALNSQEPEHLTDLHLLARSARKNLFAATDNQQEHEAFLNMWTLILREAGFVPGQATRNSVYSILPYEGPNNTVVRQFLADPMQYKPKDDADRLANLKKAADFLRGNNLPVITSFLVDSELLLKTYSLYYVTAYDEKPEHEIQLRILKKDGADASVLERAGLKVLQSVNNLVVVYLGPEVGMVYRTADKLEDLQVKILEFKKFIEEKGGVLIEVKVTELPPGSYRRYVADIYFFR